jgi:hypothetical protein
MIPETRSNPFSVGLETWGFLVWLLISLEFKQKSHLHGAFFAFE